MIYFETKEVDEVIKERIKELKEEYKQSFVNLNNELTNIFKQNLDKAFIRDNELPVSEYMKSEDIKKGKRPKFKLPSKMPYGFIRNRTGRLKNSFVYSKSVKEYKNGNMITKIEIIQDRDKAIYGRIQELGGKVKPKHRKYLAIPISSESWGKSPLDFPDTIVYSAGKFIRNIKPKALYILKKIHKGLYLPIFILKDKVEIPEHKFIASAFYKSFTLNQNSSLRDLYNKLLSKIKL